MVDNRSKVLEKISDGELAKDTVIAALLEWIPDSEVAQALWNYMGYRLDGVEEDEEEE